MSKKITGSRGHTGVQRGWREAKAEKERERERSEHKKNKNKTEDIREHRRGQEEETLGKMIEAGVKIKENN